jgi:phosphopantothenoylcysteine decarboxylase/phosphopantothenate--cysteine ligase
MGVALAEEARARGAKVTLLAANLAVPAPGGVEVVETPTAADLLREALAHGDADAVLMAAAVADYRPAEQIPHKRPKDAQKWVLELEPTADVVRELAAGTNGSVVVAFGADLGEAGLERKRSMLEHKGVDLVVFNDVSRADVGFDVEENEIVIISRSGERRVAKAPKRQIAAAILDEVTSLLR